MKNLFTVSILSLALLFTVQQADAQLIYKGIKGGLNISNIKGFDELAGISETETYNGWHAGILVGVDLPIVDVQADILYSQQGVTYTDILGGDPVDLENSYVLIPVMAKLGFIPIVNFNRYFKTT